MIGEIVHVQVGQCTKLIGKAFWNTMNIEHKVVKDGKFTANNDDAEAARRLDKIDVYFNEAGELRFVPRVALVDLEPGTLDVIKASPIDTMFKSDNFVFEGAESINEVVESCYSRQGFEITHLLGGGSSGCAASGLAISLLMKMTDNYPDKITATFGVYPSLKVSDVVISIT